jgi:hypothetical protein
MIANIAPNSASFDETMNTLKYADRAKSIKTTVTRNVVTVNFQVSGASTAGAPRATPCLGCRWPAVRWFCVRGPSVTWGSGSAEPPPSASSPALAVHGVG